MSNANEQRTVIVEDESLKQFVGGFTSIPNRVLRNSDISLGARMTYAILLQYAWQDNFCFPAQTRLATDLGIGERTVRQYLNELREAKLITWKQQGLNKPNVYRILKLPDLVPSNGGGQNNQDGYSGPANSAGQDRRQDSGQDRNPRADYKDSENNTQPNVNVSQKPLPATSNPREHLAPSPSINREALQQAYRLSDQQLSRLEYLVDRQGHFLGSLDRNQRNYIKRAAEALRDGTDGQLEMALRDFDDAAKAMKNPPRIRPAYFQTVWGHMVTAVLNARSHPGSPPEKPTLRVAQPGLQPIFDTVWSRIDTVAPPIEPKSSEVLDPIERQRRQLLKQLVDRGYQIPSHLFRAPVREIVAWHDTQPHPTR